MGPSAAGQVLDRYLQHSYEVIQTVHDNLAIIQAVANHLTPVEDLVQFQDQVEALCAKLEVMSAASEIIVQTTAAGFSMLTAVDATAQRALLSLESAALHDEDYFATAAAFVDLQSTVTGLGASLDDVLLQLPGLITETELEASLVPLRNRLTALESGVSGTMLSTRIDQLILDLANGVVVTAGGTALDALSVRMTTAEGVITNTASRTTALETNVANATGTIQGHSTALNQLTSQVSLDGENIMAMSEDITQLANDVSNQALGLSGHSDALAALTSRTEIVEGTVTSHSSQLTSLNASVQDLENQTDANATAVQSLTATVISNAAAQTITSDFTTQLASQLADAEDGILANAGAIDTLSTRVEQTEEGLVIASEDITRLTASLTGIGNSLPNAGFETDVAGWTLFSRGPGWLGAELSRDLDAATAIPPEMHALSLTAEGVPAGEAGVRSVNLPIEASSRYFLSGYLAGVNCVGRLEYRLLNVSLEEIEYDIAGVSTGPGGQTLADWDRVSCEVVVPPDGALLQVQWWIGDTGVDSPKAWLLRPMLEQAVEGQINPSPWVPGQSGMDSLFATAIESLTTRITTTEDTVDVLTTSVTDLSAELGDKADASALNTLEARVTETEDALTVQASDVTQLTSRIGNLHEWRAVVYSGFGTWDETGAPMAAGLWTTAGTQIYTFLQGLTLIQFDAAGDLVDATRYDTFASDTARVELATALNALTAQDYFLLVGQGNHGIENELLTPALEACGALLYRDPVVGSTPYLLFGRGNLGKGNGIEVIPAHDDDFIDHYFTLVNGVPKGIGDRSGLTNMVLGQADALSALTTEVTQTSDSLDVVSMDVTALQAAIEDAETGLSATAGAVQTLTTRVTDVEGVVDAMSTASTALNSRVGTMEGALTNEIITSANKNAAFAGALNDLSARMEDAEGGLAASTNAIDALTTQVENTGDEVIALGTRTSSLESLVLDPDTGVAATATAMESLDTRVTINEAGIEANVNAISALVAGTGEQFDSQRIWYFDTDLEGWNGNGVPVASGGFLRAANHATDPWVQSPTGVALSGDTYKYVKARIRKVGNPPWVGELRGYNAGGGLLGTYVTPEPPFEADGDAAVAWKDVTWSGVIDRIRLDITNEQNATDYFLIDWVAVGRPAPGASVASLLEEATARISADSALTSRTSILEATVNDPVTGIAANATAVNSLETRVSNAEDINDSQATALTLLNSTVAGKASAAALTALDTRVTTAEGTISSHTSSLTTLSARLASSGGDNLLSNSSFEGTINDYSTAVSGVTGLALSYPGSTLAASAYVVRLTGTAANNSSRMDLVTTLAKNPWVTPNKDYTLSVYARGSAGTTLTLLVQWRNSANTILSTMTLAGQSLSSTTLQRFELTGTAPAGAVKANVYVARFTAPGAGSFWGEVDNAQFEENSMATGYRPSTWNTATAVEAMDARVTQNENGLVQMYASWSITLDVNGYVSGVQSVNNGSKADFTILADNFYVIAPGVAKKRLLSVDATGLKLANDLYMGAGRIISDTGTYMKVQGTGFGTSNQFVEWYGPKMAINSCSEANAIYYLKTNGSAYFGGSLSAGTIYNAAYTTTYAYPTSAVIGPFGTNGNPKTVVVSYTLDRYGPLSASIGSGTGGTVTIKLYRTIGGNPETLLATYTVTLNRTSDPNGGGTYDVHEFGSGTWTYTDNTTGVQDRTFRVEVTSATGMATITGSGAGNSVKAGAVITEQ